ncbi:MAG: type II secretion system protein M [Burkholderiales bacterium]|nr:type II secretion system protein M [Phycisphaerae bacterium]
MTLTPRERYIATATGLVLGLAFLYWVIIGPLWKDLDDANALIDTNNAELERAANLFKNNIAARRKWKDITRGTLATDASTAESQVYNRVTQALQRGGLELQSLRPERTDSENGFRRIVLRVQASGNMSRIGRFLYAMQTSDIPLRITDLQISSKKEGTDDLGITLGVATIFDPPVVEARITPGPARREVTE